MGHVIAALYVWGIGKALNGKIILRIEDHDKSRCRKEYEESIYRDLEWLGLTWDYGPVDFSPSSFRQSDCNARYEAALDNLKKSSKLYFCNCSRKDIAADSLNHTEELLYPGTCRGKNIFLNPQAGLRWVMPETQISFIDGFKGPITQIPCKQCGDLLLKDRQQQWTYQFAVVVDDHEQKVNMIIRGEDLLASTGRQILLGRILYGHNEISYFHHPLLHDNQGMKLAKRQKSAAIALRRESHVPAENILGEAALLMGLQRDQNPIKLDELFAFIKEKVLKEKR